MGEYATRKSDGKRVKIGTCSMLYWLRYEDRFEVTDFPGTMMNRYWRLPYPEEDGKEVCKERAVEPWRDYWGTTISESIFCDNDVIAALEANEGIAQSYVEELGMLINVQCSHGLRLPESTECVQFFWNGKRSPLRLAYVKNTEKEMRLVIACKACGSSWTCSFNDIEQHIASRELRLRLLKLCQEYWWEVHDDSEYSAYKMVETLERDGKTYTVILSTDPETQDWFVTCNGVLRCNGDFDDCRTVYLACLYAIGCFD